MSRAIKNFASLISRIKRAKNLCSSLYLFHAVLRGFLRLVETTFVVDIMLILNGHAVLFRRAVERERQRRYIRGEEE